MVLYKLTYDDFCAWYLELIKPAFSGAEAEGGREAIDGVTYKATINFLKDLLKMLHPFMPFISEEIWDNVKSKGEKECIISDYPRPAKYDAQLLAGFEQEKEYVRLVRGLRQQNNIPVKEELVIVEPSFIESGLSSGILKLSGTAYKQSRGSGVLSFVLKDKKFSFVLPEGFKMDTAEEKEKLKKELEYHRGFLKSVSAKLANERFVANAKPEIVQNEKNKMADAEAKILAIEKQLEKL